LLCNDFVGRESVNEIFQSIFQFEQDRITLIWNEYDEIVLITKLIESYFNFQADELMNGLWTTIFPDGIEKEVKEHFNSSSETFFMPKLMMTTKNNSYVYFSMIISKVQTETSNVFICTLKDVTEEQFLRKKLCNLERTMMTAKMSAQMVHEIRNPLTAIKGFLQLIDAGIEHREEYVKVLLSEVEKIEGLTNELLQLANPNKGVRKTVGLKEIITDIIVLMEAQTHMRSVLFEVAGDLDVSLDCVPTEIKQALINLILNGAEAMNYQGTIWLNVTRLSDSVIIEVIDEGHGMPKQVVDKINHEFYTTKEHGTGLGLVVTEQIIEQHHGRLSVFSLENVGSTFEVQLPI